LNNINKEEEVDEKNNGDNNIQEVNEKYCSEAKDEGLCDSCIIQVPY